MAARLAVERGMRWLDAPIRRRARRAGRTHGVMVGGDPDASSARDLMDALARRATLMGPNGAGQ